MAQLHQALDDLIGAVPLGIIRALHPHAKLGGTAPVMPRFVMHKIYRHVEGGVGQESRLLQRLDDDIALADQLVDRFSPGIGVDVELINKVAVMTCQADGLHPHLVIFPARAAVADRREQIPRQPVAHVMRGAGGAKSAHVAGRAGGRREIHHRQRAGFGFPVPAVAASGIGNAMF